MNKQCLQLFLIAFNLFYTVGCSAPVLEPRLAADLNSRQITAADSIGAGQPIVFEDPVLKRYLLACVFKRENGEITVGEAERVTELILPQNDSLGFITNLSGLEHFANLQFLTIPGHHIKKADLRGFPQLLKLNLSHNSRLVTLLLPPAPSPLFYVELEGCASLQPVDFSGSANIKTLDLDNCFSYQGPLDASKMPDLHFLSLYKTPLTALNISANTYLEHLDLRYTPLDLKVSITREQNTICRSCNPKNWLYFDGKTVWNIVD